MGGGEGGGGEGGGECPKSFEVTAAVSPPPPCYETHTHHIFIPSSASVLCACFPVCVRACVCVLQLTGSSSSSCAPCFNSCASPPVPSPTAAPPTPQPIPPHSPPLVSFALHRPEECEKEPHLELITECERDRGGERERKRERGRWKEKE